MDASQLCNVLDCLLNRGTGTAEDTKYFIGIKHDVLVAAFTDYLNRHRHFLDFCHIEPRHALNERGVDLVIQTRTCRIGFQIKSHFDVSQTRFAENVKRQFAESFALGLDYYYLLVCAGMVKEKKDDYAARVTHLLNELSTFQNARLAFFSPFNTVTVFKNLREVSRDELLVRQVIPSDTLSWFERGYEHLPKPNDHEIQSATENLEAYGEDWFEVDEGKRAFYELGKLVDRKSAERFTSEFLPTLPPDILQKRKELIHETEKLLKDCRAFRSWNDRSEYKLPSWLDHVPESMIPYTSLPNLLRIVDSLREFAARHAEMSKQLA